MMEEGLLTPAHAEEFLEEIGHDTQKIESKRNKMYREQAEANALKRQSMRPDERISFHERASLQLFRGSSTKMRTSLINPLLTDSKD
eukprot:gene29553-38670_t